MPDWDRLPSPRYIRLFFSKTQAEKTDGGGIKVVHFCMPENGTLEFPHLTDTAGRPARSGVWTGWGLAYAWRYPLAVDVRECVGHPGDRGRGCAPGLLP
jgi:hypothetical protein